MRPIRLVYVVLLACALRPAVAGALDRTWSREFGIPGIDHYPTCAVRWRGGVVVGGLFDLAGRVPARNLAWWDGADWHDIGGGVDGKVECLAVVNDTLVVGGGFRHAGSDAISGAARWTGGRWLPMGSAQAVTSFTTYRGAFVALGGFFYPNEGWRNGAASWDGVAWHPLGSSFGFGSGIQAAAYHDRLYVTGLIDEVEGSPAHGLVAW